MLRINPKNLSFPLFFILLLSISITTTAQTTWFKIESDSSSVDFNNHIMIYSGRASFKTETISISGDEIKSYKTQGEHHKVQITGSLAKLTEYIPELKQLTQLFAATINYQLTDKTITAEKNIVLIQKITNTPDITEIENTSHNYFKVEGDNLNFSPAPQNILKITGHPLQITINLTEQEQLIASANKMLYYPKTQQFELSGNVILTTGRNEFKANKILYNTKTRSLQIPESKGHRVEMIQNIKPTNE